MIYQYSSLVYTRFLCIRWMNGKVDVIKGPGQRKLLKPANEIIGSGQDSASVVTIHREGQQDTQAPPPFLTQPLSLRVNA